MSFAVRAITLDLDDTLWPFAPIGARIEQAIHDWMLRHSPRTAGMFPIPAMRALRERTFTENPHLAHDLSALRRMTLAQALPSGDKMDFVVQKAVELGVARIQPLLASRSVVRLAGERAARRVEHLRQVAISACEQCGRNRLPEIAPILDLRQWLAGLAQDNEIRRLLLSPQGGRRPRELAGRRFLLLVGPEGGLDKEEAAAARLAGFADLSLGPRILRTETAGPAALAALGGLHGDL